MTPWTDALPDNEHGSCGNGCSTLQCCDGPTNCRQNTPKTGQQNCRKRVHSSSFCQSRPSVPEKSHHPNGKVKDHKGPNERHSKASTSNASKINWEIVLRWQLNQSSACELAINQLERGESPSGSAAIKALQVGAKAARRCEKQTLTLIEMILYNGDRKCCGHWDYKYGQVSSATKLEIKRQNTHWRARTWQQRSGQWII